MQFVVITIITTDPEFGLTIAAMPLTIVILVLANYWTRKENRLGMAVIIVSIVLSPYWRLSRGIDKLSRCSQTLFFAALAYFLFKLIRMYQPASAQKYFSIRRPLTAFAAITVVLIVITIVNACVCMYNFGRGLQPYLSKRKVDSEEEKTSMTEMPSYAHGPVPSRMVID